MFIRIIGKVETNIMRVMKNQIIPMVRPSLMRIVIFVVFMAIKNLISSRRIKKKMEKVK